MSSIPIVVSCRAFLLAPSSPQSTTRLRSPSPVSSPRFDLISLPFPTSETSFHFRSLSIPSITLHCWFSALDFVSLITPRGGPRVPLSLSFPLLVPSSTSLHTTSELVPLPNLRSSFTTSPNLIVLSIRRLGCHLFLNRRALLVALDPDAANVAVNRPTTYKQAHRLERRALPPTPNRADSCMYDDFFSKTPGNLCVFTWQNTCGYPSG